MKRTSRGDLSGQISPNPSAPTDTLGRIVNAKEEVNKNSKKNLFNFLLTNKVTSCI